VKEEMEMEKKKKTEYPADVKHVAHVSHLPRGVVSTGCVLSRILNQCIWS
jgi:hypothetical protein